MPLALPQAAELREAELRMRTPYEACSRCGGYGILNWGDYFPDCSDCGGSGFVRARDARGRFTTIEIPDVSAGSSLPGA